MINDIVQDLIDDNLTDPIVHIPFAAAGEDEMDALREIVMDYDIDYEVDDEYGVVKSGQVIIDLRE